MKQALILFAFFVLFVFLSCENQKQQAQQDFVKPTPIKLDSVCNWLSKKNSYSDKNYLLTFDKI